MPVILTTPEEWNMWLTELPMAALGLQRPLPDGSLMVGRGAKMDGVLAV